MSFDNLYSSIHNSLAICYSISLYCPNQDKLLCIVLKQRPTFKYYLVKTSFQILLEQRQGLGVEDLTRLKQNRINNWNRPIIHKTCTLSNYNNLKQFSDIILLVNSRMKFLQHKIAKPSLAIPSFKIFYLVSSRPQSSLRLPAFSHFPLHEGITKYLQASNMHTPTYIQYSLLSSLQSNYNKIHHITSPTGSGKTLAYMLPVLNHLKQQQLEEGGKLTQSQRPRALVITLNKQLALQTRNVGKSISHHCKMKVEGLNLGKSLRQEAKTIEDGVDVLVSTYKRLAGFIQRKQLFLSNVDWMVIDEADTFAEIGLLPEILQQFKYVYTSSAQKPTHSRLLLAGTTCPPSLTATLEHTLGKDYVQLVDKNAHINLENIKHEFVQAFEKDKHELLRSLLMRQKNTKTLVFCNTVNSLLELQHYCESQGIKVTTLHSQLNKKLRRTSYQRFRDSQDNILLSTDLGARGLDFPNLQRVINYDFPMSTTDYLQRVGRTGRAGRNGLAITVYRKKDMDVINELKSSAFDKPIKLGDSAYGLKNREQTNRSKYERHHKG